MLSRLEGRKAYKRMIQHCVCVCVQGIATPRACQVPRAGSASTAAGRDRVCESTGQGALSRGSTFNDMGEVAPISTYALSV